MTDKVYLVLLEVQNPLDKVIYEQKRLMVAENIQLVFKELAWVERDENYELVSIVRQGELYG